jgi:hypothetical protein
LEGDKIFSAANELLIYAGFLFGHEPEIILRFVQFFFIFETLLSVNSSKDVTLAFIYNFFNQISKNNFIFSFFLTLAGVPFLFILSFFVPLFFSFLNVLLFYWWPPALLLFLTGRVDVALWLAGYFVEINFFYFQTFQVNFFK